MLSQMQNYPKLTPSDVRIAGSKKEDGYTKQLLVFQTPFGYRRVAELFTPDGEGPHRSILFIHWYEPGSPSSNRSQFVEEAIELAKAGAICLTVETLWSDPDFFLKRTQADDMQSSMEEVVNERRFMDFLVSQPNRLNSLRTCRSRLWRHLRNPRWQFQQRPNSLCGHGCHASLPRLVPVLAQTRGGGARSFSLRNETHRPDHAHPKPCTCPRVIPIR